MDLFVLIIIIVFVFIIKYLIDTINSLNGEIREIKEKCIIGSKASGAGGGAGGGVRLWFSSRCCWIYSGSLFSRSNY